MAISVRQIPSRDWWSSSWSGFFSSWFHGSWTLSTRSSTSAACTRWCPIMTLEPSFSTSYYFLRYIIRVAFHVFQESGSIRTGASLLGGRLLEDRSPIHDSIVDNHQYFRWGKWPRPLNLGMYWLPTAWHLLKCGVQDPDVRRFITQANFGFEINQAGTESISAPFWQYPILSTATRQCRPER